MSRDPVGAASYLQSPNELNPWQYAASNPTRYTDPDGRQPSNLLRHAVESQRIANKAELLEQVPRTYPTLGGRLGNSTPAVDLFACLMMSADERSCRADLQWRMKLEAQLEGFVAMKNPADAWVEGMTLLPDTELADIWAGHDSEFERLGVPSIEREHFRGRARFKQSTRIVGWMSGFALGFLSPGGSEVSVAGELAQVERAPVIADAMLADSRAALSATIREAETTAARRFVWRRADSAQLYREFGAGPWHEPTLPPEELWTVMGRTSPHRDQFGFYRVLPGEGELAETVLNARRADPGARGNFAILQYRKGEETVLSPVFRSAKGVHSEQLAEIWRAENQIPIEDLIAGYTEYSPCGPRGRNAADCRRLWGYYSNVGSDFKGYYSWFYDENGRAAKRLFLRSLATGK